MGDGEGGEGLGGLDADIEEGGEAVGESADTSETGASESNTSESNTSENAEHSGFSHVSSEFSNIESNEFSPTELQNNEHVHGKDTKTDHQLSEFKTVTPNSLDTISQISNRNVYEYAARQSQSRGREFSAKALEVRDNAHLEKSSNLPRNAIGTHNINTGEIKVDDALTEKAALHVSNHEYMHESSYSEKSVSETESQKTETKVSGIFEITDVTDKNTGETSKTEFGRSLNEGITESRTLEMEKEAGIETGVSTYSTEREYTAALESIVGKDSINSAYYDGYRETLAERCNELGKNENTWNDINSLMDKISETKGKSDRQNQETYAKAVNDLENILDTMNTSRMEEIQNERKDN